MRDSLNTTLVSEPLGGVVVGVFGVSWLFWLFLTMVFWFVCLFGWLVGWCRDLIFLFFLFLMEGRKCFI